MTPSSRRTTTRSAPRPCCSPDGTPGSATAHSSATSSGCDRSCAATRKERSTVGPAGRGTGSLSPISPGWSPRSFVSPRPNCRSRRLAVIVAVFSRVSQVRIPSGSGRTRAIPDLTIGKAVGVEPCSPRLVSGQSTASATRTSFATGGRRPQEHGSHHGTYTIAPLNPSFPRFLQPCCHILDICDRSFH